MSSDDSSAKCGCIVFVVIISGLLGAYCWPYTINSWLVFFGKAPSITRWNGFILGLIPGIGQATIPAAAITWILMHFLN